MTDDKFLLPESIECQSENQELYEFCAIGVYEAKQEALEKKHSRKVRCKILLMRLIHTIRV